MSVDKLKLAVEALEPFALMSSEGVVKQVEGHTTVVTCAEYFHRAASALAAIRAPEAPGEVEGLRKSLTATAEAAATHLKAKIAAARAALSQGEVA